MASALEKFSFTVWVIIILVKMDGHTCCIKNERKALLELKDYVNSVIGDDAFPSWKNDTENNCCNWEEIQCSLANGHVIGINLNWLDLNFLLNLSLLHPFEELQSLNISDQLGGWFDPTEGYKSLARLTKLEIMDLTYSGVNNSILPFLSAATSLKTLILRKCNLAGLFPIKELKVLKNLEILDLSGNFLNGSLPGQELANLHKLKALDLSGNDYFASLDARGICELKNLQELDLSGNKFVGHIPLCFGGLSKLQVLDLSENQLNGSLPSLISNLRSLEYFSLYGNSFEGLFSLIPLTNLSKLKVFKLSSTSQLLQLEMRQGFWQPKFQLNVIGLKYCNLGEIPSFLEHQRGLRKIDLSNNKLSAVFPAWILENNPELEILQLGDNALFTFQVPRLFHNLKVLELGGNHFVGRLPDYFGLMLPNIRSMNLSHNGFSGILPWSLGEMRRIQFMDLSYNSFRGHVFQKPTNLTYLKVLKMNNNQLTGEIGGGLRNSSSLYVLDLSNNHLTGAIPSWIGTFPLFELSLYNNGLQGGIPVSLFNQSSLAVLDLSGNMLSGNLPSRVTTKFFGASLYLQDNDLTGNIPDTLLENLRLLDLRYNKLSGSIPQFLHTQNITILLLRGNNLTGHIPMTLCSLTQIIVLDLAYNSLNGSIPSCLRNISFGLEKEIGSFIGLIDSNGNGEYYMYKSMLELDVWMNDPHIETSRLIEFDFSAKHRYDSYTGYMYGLDLAGNELSGEIPKELGDLQRIRALNLSHNVLSGHIPESFSNMTNLESLDLSFNKLSGLIPHEFATLHSLSVFNVSYNNLSGAIPQEGKLTTLEANGYIGNPFLCGRPTNQSCSNANGSETEEEFTGKDKDTVIDKEAFYWSLTVTYVTLCAGFLLFLCFQSPPRQAWLSFIDDFIRLARRALS